MKKSLYLSLVAFGFSFATEAQITTSNWTGGLGGNWSSTDSWSNGVPSGNTVRPQGYGTADSEAVVDQSYTIAQIVAGPKGATWTISGGSTLTIDPVNAGTGAYGIRTATASSDPAGTLRFNGNVRIAHSSGSSTVTTIDNTGNSGNQVLFDTGSVLTIDTLLKTVQGAGGAIRMNGTLAASAANLQIQSSNLSFGVGHDSTAFGKDIVFFAGSKLTIDGGSVLNAGRKFQVNGNAEIALNGANAINNANIVVGGGNNLLLDVNSNQGSMGTVLLTNGILTMDLDPTVALIAFGDSSGLGWGSGSFVVNGFREGVIRFGTDGNGLTATQLGAINGGAYSLSSSGFLTAVPEPSTYALFLGIGTIGFLFFRRRRN